MSIKPYSKTKEKLIVNNILTACDDISRLNSTGYNFLYLCSGFIAHCNLAGFQDAFRREGSLRHSILAFAERNKWGHFKPGDRDYEYYSQKGQIYQEIVRRLANDSRKKFTVQYSRTYVSTGTVEIIADTEEEAKDKVQGIIGDLSGSMQYDPDQDTVEILK